MIKQTSMRIIYGILFFFYLCQNVYSQNYFQQDVKYTINVTLNDKKHLLTGSEDIYYKNNSTTILNELYFHLYPNAYKNTSTTLAKELYNVGAITSAFTLRSISVTSSGRSSISNTIKYTSG